ncbi:hypothetical protein VMCG_09900 [Cytospora schulzeri]|uniref:non-specific serine/threonine protein kinase n=1 Tax=Cytospora schulzeri TaxID=448051 RepID=A0A423VE24_9PEZI|nr:hypothetical protein VMCG_09900 [Valsa malicola]
MEGPQELSSDTIFDRFRDYVQENWVAGLEVHEPQASYIPTSKLRDYWTHVRVSEVVHVTECQVPIKDIREQYLQAFSIMVWISKTRRPYIRYLHSFNRYERGDSSLPFHERPRFLPSSNDADEFWAAFQQHQWAFCPVALGPRRLHDRKLHEKQILPLQIVKKLGHVKDGKPAKVELAKLQSPTELILSNQAQDQVVLKSYPPNADRIFRNEFKAFTTFENAKPCENILKYLGSFHTATGDGTTYTIILEYADKGTLLDIYRRNQPPVKFEEIQIFWSAILKMVKALMAVQYTLQGKVAEKCIHQDLKPSNIFAFSDDEETSEDFKATFKIGDFGESSVMRTVPYDQTSSVQDNKSSRIYCPPELHWNDEVDFPVGPLVDVWSLGCVIVETALWVTFGERERLAFQQRRREENGRVSPIQRGLGRGDCFHNGKERLKTVTDVYDLILRDGRRSDGLTPDIVRLVLDFVLVEADGSPSQQLESRSGILSIDEETYMGGSRYQKVEPSRSSRPQIDPRSHAHSDPSQWSTGRVGTAESSRSKATITQARKQEDKTYAPEPPRPDFPLVTIAEVNERRTRQKEKDDRPFLPGESRAMGYLKNRDHVFLIDNSKSMQQHRKAVIETFTNLAYILEKADEDGLDVLCTSDWGKQEHGRRAKNLAAFVDNNFHKGGDSCPMENSLLALTTNIIQDLPSKGAKRNRTRMSLFGKKSKGRPTSIYILTNGVWNSSPAARDGVYGADRPLRQLIRELQDRNLHKSQVSIQFIRFGNDATGIRRLTSLDDDLGKEFQDFDIVDHKDSTGGVWPMLVGSLDEGVDLEKNTSEDRNT